VGIRFVKYDRNKIGQCTLFYHNPISIIHIFSSFFASNQWLRLYLPQMWRMNTLAMKL